MTIPPISYFGMWCLMAVVPSALAIDAVLTDDVSVSSVSGARAPNGYSPTLVVSRTDTVYIRFDINSVLPADVTAANIGKATLRLWVSKVIGNEFGACAVYQVISDPFGWVENSISNRNPPGLGNSSIAITRAVRTYKQFLVFDVTPLVQQWISGVPNFGIAIRGIDVGSVEVVGAPPPSPPLHAFIDSKENAATGHLPALEITLKAY